MPFTFTVPGAPRTKKTSNRVVNVGGFHKVLPSKAHEKWFKAAEAHALLIKTKLRQQGAELPLRGRLRVTAVFFLENANWGDLNGYQQALADWMQEATLRRPGMGIIVDDKYIESWGESRRDTDRENPRIEVSIEVIG